MASQKEKPGWNQFMNVIVHRISIQLHYTGIWRPSTNPVSQIYMKCINHAEYVKMTYLTIRSIWHIFHNSAVIEATKWVVSARDVNYTMKLQLVKLAPVLLVWMWLSHKDFIQNAHSRHPKLAPENEIWGVFCEFKLWSIFCRPCCWGAMY